MITSLLRVVRGVVTTALVAVALAVFVLQRG